MAEPYQVKPSDKLLRWLHPGQIHPEENRPTSAAFRDFEMSVDILSLTTIEESYNRAKKIGKNAVVSIKAQLIIEKGLEICHEPVEGNDAHAVVLGKKTNSIAKFLANNCEIEIYPPNQ
ncbi:hypothetical protein [Nostoc sp. C117]|uniref:hypothetical protein n=1 Tax=Nostoc sp. C117 TaxID=3349875 RepID=UPI00370D7ECE